MGALIGSIIAVVQSYVQAVVISVVGSMLTAAVQSLVVNLLTAAVLAVVTGALLQVVGKLFGIEGVTDGLAKILYTIAIIIIVIAAVIAQSLMLALTFLGAAFVFLLLVDTVFGTKSSKTFTDAAIDIVEAVVDIVGEVIGGVVDIIGTGVSSLFGGKFFTYLLIGAAAYVGYKVLSKDKPSSSEIRLNVQPEKPSGDPSYGYAAESVGTTRTYRA